MSKYHYVSKAMELSIEHVKTNLFQIKYYNKQDFINSHRVTLFISRYIFTNYNRHLNLLPAVPPDESLPGTVPKDNKLSEYDNISAYMDGYILASIILGCTDNCRKYYDDIKNIYNKREEVSYGFKNNNLYFLSSDEIPRFVLYFDRVFAVYNFLIGTGQQDLFDIYKTSSVEKKDFILTEKKPDNVPPDGGKRKRKTKKYRTKKRKTHRRKY
jgi:hypothetical protein